LEKTISDAELLIGLLIGLLDRQTSLSIDVTRDKKIIRSNPHSNGITSFDQYTTGQTSAAPRMRGPGVAVLSVPVNSPVSNKIFCLTSTKYLASLQFWTAELMRIDETAENEYGNETTKYYLRLH